MRFPADLLDKHRDKVCVVLGNGPSIADYDLRDPFFTQNVTLGCNNIGRLFLPTYYFIGDPMAWRKFGHLVREPSTLLLGQYVQPKPQRKHFVIPYDLRNGVGPPKRGQIVHGRTAGMVTLHIAYSMGFRYFFLLGIDGYSTAGNPHFYTEGSAGRATSDRTVSQCLTEFFLKLRDEDKYVWNLSNRSVFEQIPLFPGREDPPPQPPIRR